MTMQVVPERGVVDLAVSRFEHVVHGIRVTGTWLTTDTREPCLALTNAGWGLRDPRTIVCLVPLSSAYLWTLEFGDPRHTARHCYNWIRAGALPGNCNDAKDCRKVFDAVQSRLTDLIHMPPAPIRRQEIAGDMTFRNLTTGAVKQTDIFDDV